MIQDSDITKEKLRVISNNNESGHVKGQKLNPYCERIGIRAPVLEELTSIKDLKLFHFMVLAILENSGPMPLESIAERLESIGLTSRLGDLLASLKKAWHGKEPVYKTPDGLYDVNPDSHETNFIALMAGLKYPKGLPTPPAPKPILIKQPSERFSQEEIKITFKDRTTLPISSQIAAVLDANDKEMALSEIDSFLDSISQGRKPFTLKGALKWRSPLIQVSPEGLVKLTASQEDLYALRNNIRQIAAKEAAKRAQNEQIEQTISQRQEFFKTKENAQKIDASKLRRAVVYAFYERKILAAALLDCENRLISTYVGDDLMRLPKDLTGFDLLAGLCVREILHDYSLDPMKWRIIDLNPPQKTRKINKSGRLLHIDIEMLISSSVQISRPLGDPQKILSYIQNGDDTKLRRRLEASVKSLFAFYNYTRLHGVARLKWGFLDENLPSPSWRMPGDACLYSIAKEAQDANKFVDIVCSSAPGWSDPWSRSIQGRVVDVNSWYLILDQNGLPVQIDRREIQAIRFSPQSQ